MPKVIALYRYPVKGFNAQAVTQLTVLPGGRVAGDRVLNFRFADAPVSDDMWCRKYHGVVLANTPGLAQLQLHFDECAQRIIISHKNQILVEDSLGGAGRRRLAQALTDFVLSLPEHPLHDLPTRLPVKLVGDGRTPRIRITALGR